MKRELKSSSAALTATASSTIGTSSSFKDYEKKTNDVWDIDDEFDCQNDEFNSFPISIVVS